MSELYEKSITKLELDRVLQMLADCAGSADGKAACLEIKPISDVDDVKMLLAETTAAVDLSTKKGYPVFLGARNVAEILDRADRGGSLQPRELLTIAGVLRCTRNAKDYMQDGEDNTVLDPYFLMLTPNKYLEERIFAAIISEEEIADAASPELADIRRHMRIQSGKIKESLQKIISSPAYAH